jgi:uncharacterized protein
MRLAFKLATFAVVGLALASAFLAENALHIWNRPAADGGAADAVARQGGASWRAVQITAEDGARLDAWLFTPREGNGAGVILLHGIADTRMGMSGHAPWLLRAGYTVLLPDSRGHGASGGEIITYGIREAGDVHRWADLLLREQGVTRLFGIGQSMGAAILLESLPGEPRFRAVVADCPFATFEEVAYDRMVQHGPRVRGAYWPVVNLGFLYARARYGVDLWHASPADAIRATHTPVLLIHGAADSNIPPRHSRELRAINPASTELWEVPRAGHVASLGTEPAAYCRRVIAWFTRY